MSALGHKRTYAAQQVMSALLLVTTAWTPATGCVRFTQDLLVYARSNRGKLSIGFDNTASAAAFAAKLFNRRADLGLVEVPYRSASHATQDAASGVTQVLMSAIAAANALVEAGKLRRLAVTSVSAFPRCRICLRSANRFLAL